MTYQENHIQPEKFYLEFNERKFFVKDSILHPKNRFLWSLLALQGGFVNVGGLLTVHIFVSHVTGFSAHFSTNLLNGDFLKSLFFLLVPLFFLMGSFFSSLFTEVRKQKHEDPIYIYILLSLCGLYLLVSLLGYLNFFGTFGEPFQSTRDFMLLSLLAFSCGTQNAIFTHYSKSIIRTTHLTGLTTDLGIGMAKYLVAKDSNEKYLNKIRIDLIVSFILGSLLGGFLFPRLQFLGFLLPTLINFYIGIRLLKTRKNTL